MKSVLNNRKKINRTINGMFFELYILKPILYLMFFNSFFVTIFILSRFVVIDVINF